MTRKRDPIKHIRDRAKSAYAKGDRCEICGTSELLEFHHYHTMTLLLAKWLRASGNTAATDEDVLSWRDEFIEAHRHEIYSETVTLCKKHHALLHKLYGKAPALATAEKQKRWVVKQYDKLNS